MDLEPSTGREARTLEEAPTDEKGGDVPIGVTIRYDPAVGTIQRLRFKPRPEGGFILYSEEWTGRSWRTRTEEPVNHATLSVATGEADLETLVTEHGGQQEATTDG